MLSLHAQALDTVRKDPQKDDSCLSCHSLDYGLAATRNTSRVAKGLQPTVLPSISDQNSSNDPLESVGCGACHQPHGSAIPNQLRDQPSATCAKCHTDPQSPPKGAPHAPQGNLLAGTGGMKLDAASGSAAPLVGVGATHNVLDSVGGCAKCHGERARVAAPTAENPNKTGHDFNVRAENCGPCHSAADAAVLVSALRAEVDGRAAALRQRIAAVNRSALSAARRNLFDAATLDVDLVAADRSGGAHNATYTRQLLVAADSLMDATTAP
jgi:predicted CXXCH cytochrome family protein